MLHFTKFTSKRKPLTKSFEMNDHLEIKKIDGGRLIEGWQEQRTVANLVEFFDEISTYSPRECAAYSLCELYDESKVVLKDLLAARRERFPHEKVVSRTKNFFSFAKKPGIGAIDYDYDASDKQKCLSREELVSILFETVPELKGAQIMAKDSTSAFIKNEITGQYHSTEKGKRVYFAVQDASDLARIGKIIFKRFWLNGQGFIKVESGGSMSVKSLLDLSMFEDARFDFAWACCGENISQTRREPLFYNVDAEPFDTRLIQDLSDEDESRYNEMVRIAKEEKKPSAIVKLSRSKNITIEQASRDIARAGKYEILPLHHILYFQNGDVVSVGDVMLTPGKYHEKSLCDPLEPNYGGSGSNTGKAKFFWNKDTGGMTISSYAHGKRLYKFETPGVRFNKPQQIIETETGLKTFDEGRKEIEQHIKRFFETGKSMVVKGTAGCGKSFVAQNIARTLPQNKKVLYVVPDHDLGEEVVERINEIEKPIEERTTKWANPMPISNNVVQWRGKDKLCENKVALEAFQNAKLSIPFQFCRKSCPFFGTCPVETQYKTTANIRVMANTVLFTEESVFSRGFSEENNKMKIGAEETPDFIVMDESGIKLDCVVESYEKTNYESIRALINKLVEGDDLKLSCVELKHDIKADHAMMMKRIEENAKNIKSIFSTDDLKSIIQEIKNKEKESEILKRLYLYVKTLNDDELKGVRFMPAEKHLRLSFVQSLQKRFEGVPMLILDGTANEKVSEALYPDFEFHQIDFKKSDSIKVFQMSDRSMSRSFLGREGVLQRVVEELKGLVRMYGKDEVVIITYKNLNITQYNNQKETWEFKESIRDFDVWLGGVLGIQPDNCAHFGDVRGKDKWKRKNIIVLGRQWMPRSAFDDWCYAVFGGSNEDESIQAKLVECRVSGGRFAKLSNSCFVDTRLDAIQAFCCQGDQIQTAARNRHIHDFGERHLWLLSNASLGEGMEVDEFFSYDFMFGDQKTRLQHIREDGGVVQNKRKNLCQYFSKEMVEKRPDEVVSILTMGGFELFSREIRSATNRHKRQVEFWSLSEECLAVYFQAHDIVVLHGS